MRDISNRNGLPSSSPMFFVRHQPSSPAAINSGENA